MCFPILYSEIADIEIKYYSLSGHKALNICELFKHFRVNFKPNEKPNFLNL